MQYELLPQISFFVVNQPGELNRLLESLQKVDVNLRAISVTEDEMENIIRVVPEGSSDDILESLRELGVEHFEEDDIFAVQLGSGAGALLRLTRALSEANINIQNAYGCNGNNGKAMIYLHVEDTQLAAKIFDDLPSS